MVRGLRRAGQFIKPRLEGRDPRILNRDPFLSDRQTTDQRRDQHVFLGMAQVGEVDGRGHPKGRIEAPVTVSS